ncbi:hypothetical protein FD724_40170 (plasmid) [Nostoc sp. C057]|uniref:hypothetical protein n=1 Tax=Nostoc sp. C057 TaxID=2576903 RepID=UPI0015C3DE6B|nr:hypothetical protein [Nostoc sp. C057]QLE54027.1 hypothetical protein FD724_40170 [Nostoc sp. C057]
MGGTDLLAIAICAEKSPHPSIQSTVGHLSAVEQICRLHISNSSIAPRRSPLLPKKRIVLPISSFERWRCFARLKSDRQPQTEAKNAFKNLLVRNFRT